jgi:hypothetical protein
LGLFEVLPTKVVEVAEGHREFEVSSVYPRTLLFECEDDGASVGVPA